MKIFKQAIFFFLVVMLSMSVFGQNKLDVVLQRGHKKGSYDSKGIDKIYAVSHDDKWVVSRNNYEDNVVIWSLSAARIYATYPFSIDINSAVFLTNNEDVLINSQFIFNIHSGKVTRTFPFFQNKNNLLSIKTGWSMQQQKLIYNVVDPTATKSYLDTLIPEYSKDDFDPTHFCLKKDSSVLFGARNGIVYVYNIPTRIITEEIRPEAGTIREMAYNEHANALVIAGERRTCIYYLTTKSKSYINCGLLNFRCDDEFNYASGLTYDEPAKINVWKLQASPILLFTIPIEEKLDGPAFAEFLPSQMIHVFINNKPAKKLTLPSGNKIWEDKQAATTYEYSVSRKYLIGSYQYTEKRAYDAHSMESILPDNIVAHDLVISPDEKYMLIRAQPTASYQDDYTLYQLEGSDQDRQPITVTDDVVNYFKKFVSSPLVRFTFTPQSDKIVFSTDNVASVLLYDIRNKSFLAKDLPYPTYPFSSLEYSGDAKFLLNIALSNSRIYDAGTFKGIEDKSQQELSRTIVAKGDKLAIITKADDNCQNIHLVSCLTGEDKAYKLSKDLTIVNTNHNGTKFAYGVNKGFKEKGYVSTIYIVDAENGETDSVDIAGNEYVSQGSVIFDRMDRVLYITLDKFYVYDIGSRLLKKVDLNRSGNFYAFNTNINDEYILGYERSDNHDTVRFFALSAKNFQPLISYDTYIAGFNHFESNPAFKCYPDIFNYSKELNYSSGIRDRYVCADDSIPAFIINHNPNIIVGKVEECAVTHDRKKVLDVTGGELRIINCRTFNLLNTIKPYNYTTIGFTANKRYAYCSDEAAGANDLKIYDAAKGFKKVPFIHLEGEEGYYIYFKDQPVFLGQRMELSSNGSYLAVQNSDSIGFIKVYEFPSGKEIFSMNEDYLLNKERNSPLFNALYGMTLSENEKTLVCPTYKNFLLRINTADKTVEKLACDDTEASQIWRFYVSKDGKWVAAFVNDTAHETTDPLQGKIPPNDWGKLVVWDEHGKAMTVKSNISDEGRFKSDIGIFEKTNLLCIKTIDGLHFYNLNDLREVKRFTNPDITNYNVDTNNRLIIYYTGDKQQQFHLPDFKPDYTTDTTKRYQFTYDGTFQYLKYDTQTVAKFVFDNTNDEILWFSPTNYYAVPKASTNAIAFKYGHDIYPPSVFDLQFNRPDILFSLLQPVFNFPDNLIRTYKKAYETRNSMALQNDLGQDFSSLPSVDINTLGKETITNNKKYTVELSINNKTRDEFTYNVIINGTPLFGIKGKPAKGNQIINKVDIPLLPGNNLIEGIATTKNGLNSLPATMTVYLSDSSIVSHTYFIGVGVSEYKDTSMRLRLAAKDIRDMASTMYSRDKTTIIDTFINGRVLRKNILGLRKKLLATKPEDKIIFYYSGHGIVNNGYYLATSNMDFGAPGEMGLNINDIYNLLDSIPARNKLIMLDACKSGKLYGNESNDSKIIADDDNKDVSLNDIMENVFADYNNNYGINVLAATEGTNQAIEFTDLNNSIFTDAVLKALTTNLDGRAKKGKISLNMLKAYVCDMVSIKTGGFQVPNSRNENDIADWEF